MLHVIGDRAIFVKWHRSHGQLLRQAVRYCLYIRQCGHLHQSGAERMAMVETRYEHIFLQDGKVPTIAGTTMKVIELVTAQQAYGWSPDELAFQHPYLTLGQIHSALAYYWDH